jgi:hypothetical protein
MQFCLAFLIWLAWPGVAWANNPPSPPAFLATLALLPLTMLIFTLGGAAAWYDAQRQEERPGRRRLRRTLVLFAVVLFTSGMHEGFTAMWGLLLTLYALVVAVRMLRAPAGLSRACGALLIPLAVFLGGFGVTFVGVYTFGHEQRLIEAMRQFAAYQRGYAARHGGRFQRLTTGDTPHDAFREAGMYRLESNRDRSVSITYSPDLRRYEIRVQPRRFLPWPYRYFNPRYSYYLDQGRIIRHERLHGPGIEATAASAPLEAR